MRTQLATVQGASIPWPYGGKMRLVSIDIDSAAMQAKGLSPTDVVNAVSAENLILPSGTAKLGPLEYQVEMNGSTQTINELNDLPVKTANGATIYIRDVAHVRDGFSPQTNIVRQDGHRSALLSVYKTGSASTSGDRSRRACGAFEHGRGIAAGAENHAAVRSIHLRARSRSGRHPRGAHRGLSYRRHDPALPGQLAQHADYRYFDSAGHLVSIVCLSVLGQTMNLMTLGGLALAVGILVDDATVEIENISATWPARQKTSCEAICMARRRSPCRRSFRRCASASFRAHVFLERRTRFLFVPAGRSRHLRDAGFLSAVTNAGADMVMFLLRNHNPHQTGAFARFHGSALKTPSSACATVTGMRWRPAYGTEAGSPRRFCRCAWPPWVSFPCWGRTFFRKWTRA